MMARIPWLAGDVAGSLKRALRKGDSATLRHEGTSRRGIAMLHIGCGRRARRLRKAGQNDPGPRVLAK
jgi:hypothetical protein